MFNTLVTSSPVEPPLASLADLFYAFAAVAAVALVVSALIAITCGISLSLSNRKSGGGSQR